MQIYKKKILNNPIFNSLKLIRHLNKKLKLRFILLSSLIIINSITEIISISAIIPFLIVLTNPEKISQNFVLKFILDFLNLSPENSVLFFSSIFGFLILSSALLRFTTLRFTCNFCAKATNFLATKGYRNYISQNYQFFLNNNSNDFVNTLSNEVLRSSGAIECIFTIFSSSILSALLLFSLLLVNAQITLIIFTSISFVYLLVVKNIKKELLKNSKLITQTNSQLIKMLQESFGGIRDTLINNNQDYLVEIYKKEDYLLRDQLELNKLYKKSPKYFIEAIGIILLIFISIYIIVIQKNENVIPLIGFVAFAFQKLLTAAQQIYVSWSSICLLNSSILSLTNTLNIIPTKIYKSKRRIRKFHMEKGIVLKNIFFKYENQKEAILKGINLEVKKGEVIGIVGKTGSGKSTLLDIINGLVKPTSGELIIDNFDLYKEESKIKLEMWQNCIAHVPQSIFLSNDSIMNNIAFGFKPDSIDKKRINESAMNAFLLKDIEKMPNSYGTYVGERGTNLSGGQLQRLGIARALYKNKDLLILDEITSSLDKNTEDQIINVLNKLSKNLTIIIVAHRLSTLKYCDRIYELNKGIISEVNI